MGGKIFSRRRISSKARRSLDCLFRAKWERYLKVSFFFALFCLPSHIIAFSHTSIFSSRLLFEFGADEDPENEDEDEVSEEVRCGVRIIMESVLNELMKNVHQTPDNDHHTTDQIPIMVAVGNHLKYFVESFMLSEDSFQKKSILTLLSCYAIYKGELRLGGTCSIIDRYIHRGTRNSCEHF